MTIRFSLLLTMLVSGASDLFGQDANQSLSRIDSVILVRTGCLGTCPAYRLHVPARGEIRFVSENPGDAGRSATQPSTTAIMQRIERVITENHFASLPEMRSGVLPYCRVMMTDHPTISVTLYRERMRISRNYYLGCGGNGANDTLPRPYLRSLMTIADSIDAIATKNDWIRPVSLERVKR